jgi:hypothetical protein
MELMRRVKEIATIFLNDHSCFCVMENIYNVVWCQRFQLPACRHVACHCFTVHLQIPRERDLYHYFNTEGMVRWMLALTSQAVSASINMVPPTEVPVRDSSRPGQGTSKLHIKVTKQIITILCPLDLNQTTKQRRAMRVQADRAPDMYSEVTTLDRSLANILRVDK